VTSARIGYRKLRKARSDRRCRVERDDDNEDDDAHHHERGRETRARPARVARSRNRAQPRALRRPLFDGLVSDPKNSDGPASKARLFGGRQVAKASTPSLHGAADAARAQRSLVRIDHSP
jgi:hypothetical protein